MPQHSWMCTVLLKLAKVERLKIRKFWVNVLLIECIMKGGKLALTVTYPFSIQYMISTWTVVSANFHRSLGQTMIILLIHGVC